MYYSNDNQIAMQLHMAPGSYEDEESLSKKRAREEDDKVRQRKQAFSYSNFLFRVLFFLDLQFSFFELYLYLICDQKNRGNYRCSRCNLPKKGHVCPYQPRYKRRDQQQEGGTASFIS